MTSSTTELVVRYAETDQMGIVHHSVYPIYFEAGRTDFIRKLGIPYSRIEEDGLLLPLIELKCGFKSAAKYEEVLTIRTTLKEITKTRAIFGYEVLRQGMSDPITVGETSHVWTDRNLKPLNLKKHRPELYELLCTAL